MQHATSVPMTLVIYAVDEAIARGEGFGEVEDMINTHTELSEDQKAAAWLYAWSCLGRAQRRHMASSEFAGV